MNYLKIQKTKNVIISVNQNSLNGFKVVDSNFKEDMNFAGIKNSNFHSKVVKRWNIKPNFDEVDDEVFMVLIRWFSLKSLNKVIYFQVCWVMMSRLEWKIVKIWVEIFDLFWQNVETVKMNEIRNV